MSACRMPEFARWNRVMLIHERDYLNGQLSASGALMAEETREAIGHDLKDLDYLLHQLDVRRYQPCPLPRT